MTNQQHPIVPPPELVQEWIKECDQPDDLHWQQYEQDITTRAAQWGADQELEACIDWLANARNHSLTWEEATNYSATLRNHRRPKPPSLSRVALLQLDVIRNDLLDVNGEPVDLSQIRCALERLKELEGGNG